MADIKIVSWNIQSGKNKEKILNFLQSHEFDIICLQEVREEEINGLRQNSAEIIAQKLGLNIFYSKAFTSDRHETVFDLGNAILTKFPILESHVHVLSDLTVYERNSETEPRIAIISKLKIETRELTIINTHLAYSDHLKGSALLDQQTEKLLSTVENENTILVGDFNSTPGSKTITDISSKIRNADNNPVEATWSVVSKNYKGFVVNGLEYRIDHIFVSEDLKVKECKVLQSDASDHLPLYAEILV